VALPGRAAVPVRARETFDCVTQKVSVRPRRRSTSAEEAIMSTETFVATILQTVVTYVQGFIPTDLSALVPSPEVVAWAQGVLGVLGALLGE
jgi:hypothetical protein